MFKPDTEAFAGEFNETSHYQNSVNFIIQSLVDGHDLKFLKYIVSIIKPENRTEEYFNFIRLHLKTTLEG